MIAQLDSGQRRTLAVAILGAVLLLGWSTLVLPLISIHRHHEDWRSSTLATLARYRALAAHAGSFAATRDRFASDPLWARLYAAPEASAAAAQMQGELGGLYQPTGVQMQLVQSLEPVEVEGITRVGVRLTFAATIDQLAAFFAAVESAPRLLKLDEVYVTSPEYQDSAANPILSVRADVWGYLQPQRPLT